MRHKDEDVGYEMERQRKIDEKFMRNSMHMPPKFGGALRRNEWIQKSVNKDPRPDLPFQEDDPFSKTDHYLAWGIVIVVSAVALLNIVLVLA